MTRRKENILILVCTLVILGLLTWWRTTVLTMQEDTGPLPEGQRSLKPVELPVESSVDDTWKNLVTAYELAKGIQIKQFQINTQSTAPIELPVLNASSILLIRESRRALWQALKEPWEETRLMDASIQVSADTDVLYLVHFPLSEADSNVAAVVEYFSGEPQLKVLYGPKTR